MTTRLGQCRYTVHCIKNKVIEITLYNPVDISMCLSYFNSSLNHLIMSFPDLSTKCQMPVSLPVYTANASRCIS